MKAMILAAGRGERLKPLTDHTAKPLIKANNKPLIEYHLTNLRDAGFTEVIINTCWMADKITTLIGDGGRFSLNIQYSHEPQALETAGGVAQALPLLGVDPFLLISADIWCDYDLKNFTAADTGSLAHLLLVNNPAHNSDGDFSLNEGIVCKRVINRYTYSGMGVFSPDLFRCLSTRKAPLRDALAPAIAAKQVSGTSCNNNWFDVGTIERLAELETHLAGR